MTEEPKNGVNDAPIPTELEEKIIQQVEYYFGDINLPRDKFLQKEIAKEEGWVPLETMIKFNRLKELSTDLSFIAAALRKSKSGLLEVGEDPSPRIRRSESHPLPENSYEYWQAVKSRTVYVKGFPEDAKLDDLQAFFRPYGSLCQVLMRRRKVERLFKGSVFATYSTLEECKNFLTNGPSKYGETEISKMIQSDYMKMKSEQRKEWKLEQKQAKRQTSKPAASPPAEPAVYTKGLVLKVSGLPGETEPRTVRGKFAEYGDVEWISMEKGDPECFVRFRGEENAAKSALEKAEAADGGAVKMEDKKLEVVLLEGEEEAAYHKKSLAEKRQRLTERKAHKFGSKKGERREYKGRDKRKRGGDGAGVKPQGKRTVFKDEDEEDKKEEKPSAEELREEREAGEAPKSKIPRVSDLKPEAVKGETEAE